MTKLEINDKLYKLIDMVNAEANKFPETHLADTMDLVAMELEELHDEIAEDDDY